MSWYCMQQDNIHDYQGPLYWHIFLNSKVFIQENVSENVVCEMVVICFSLNVLNII